MLAWLLGAENSFSRALLYNILTFNLLLIFGIFVYGITIGLPMLVMKFTDNK